MTVALWGIVGALIAYLVHSQTRGFFSPNAYKDDPYGHVVNQIGHWGVMVAGVALIAGGSIICFAYVPYKAELIALGVMFSGVFQYLQWSQSGGEFWDSVEDFVFMCHGWLMPIYGVTLYDSGQPKLIDWGVLIFWLFVFFVHLGAGVVFRWQRS